MINAYGEPRVIEYNCRFGDPETQPIMMRLQSDLVALCNAALDGNLDQAEAEWDSRPSVGVVLAAEGYPASYEKGREISGLGDIENSDQKIFHAGTVEKDGKILTSGGRVLCATALGSDVAGAQKKAYELADSINWQGITLRRDIAWRAINR
jgi:phosphoribosylamine--glycine ligase